MRLIPFSTATTVSASTTGTTDATATASTYGLSFLLHPSQLSKGALRALLLTQVFFFLLMKLGPRS